MNFASLKTNLKSKPRQWLVTGVAGFIGSNLLETLLGLDQTVTGIDDFSTGKKANLQDVQNRVLPAQWNRFAFVEGDVAVLETCRQVVNNVDCVLHQAALGSVPRSIEDPVTAHQSNVTGMLNVLVAAHEAGVKRVVYASSSSVYGNHPGLPQQEKNAGQLLSPYALTKYVNELYATVFAGVYGLQVIGLRYFNVFGRRQDPKGAYAAVIPKWVAAMIKQEPVVIFGDGETSRDFCFVDNVVQANLLAATTQEASAINQVYNIAVSDRTTLNQLFGVIKENLSGAFSFLTAYRPQYSDFRAGDIRHSQADISKAQQLLDYVPTHSFAEGMRETIPWYVESLS